MSPRNDYTDPTDKPNRYTTRDSTWLENTLPNAPPPCDLHGIVDCPTCKQECPICHKALGDGHSHSELPARLDLPAELPQLILESDDQKLQRLHEELLAAEDEVEAVAEGSIETLNAAREKAREASRAYRELHRKLNPLPKTLPKTKQSPKKSDAWGTFPSTTHPLPTNRSAPTDLDNATLQIWMKIAEKASRRWCYKKPSEDQTECNERRKDAAMFALMTMIEPQNIREILDAPNENERRKRACTIAKRKVITESTRAYVKRNVSASQMGRGRAGDDHYDPSGGSLEDQSLSEIMGDLDHEFPEQSAFEDKHIHQVAAFLYQALENLPPEEERCVKLRLGIWGIHDSGPRTYEEVAKCLTSLAGIDGHGHPTGEVTTVRQIKYLMKKAMAKLKKYLEPLLFPHDGTLGPLRRDPLEPLPEEGYINPKGKKIRPLRPREGLDIFSETSSVTSTKVKTSNKS
jgi:hypothetical protein